MELFIIRHGESIGNLIKEDMPDGELTPLGREQAAKVCEAMKGTGVEYIAASPLQRGVETAQPLAQTLGLPIHVWADTYEVRSKGPYTGPTPERMKEMYPETVCGDDYAADGWYCSGDETPETGQARAQRVYDRLCAQFAGKRVALFAHSGFNRHLLLVALGLPQDSPVYLHNSNGAIFWLTVTAERTTLNYVGGARVMPNP